MPFLLDQVIHVGTLIVVLSLALPAEQVWSSQSSVLAMPSIYAACYLVATLAVPIGLIVVFDPTFQHASLAAAARGRSLLAAGVVLSLSLFATPLALPAALASVVVASRRPASRHPLDSPTGLIAVLIIAASLGAALTMIQH
ncbi:MAG: hypothetical protein HGA65_07335 [Oscillochloris sp.]|nr:hypothetical protein [Oscillochloris sp.]